MKKTKEFEELLNVFSQLMVLRTADTPNSDEQLGRLALLEDFTRKQLFAEVKLKNDTTNLDIWTSKDKSSFLGQKSKSGTGNLETIATIASTNTYSEKEAQLSGENTVKSLSNQNLKPHLRLCFIHGADHLKNESPQLFDLRERFADFKNHGEYVFLEAKGKRFFEQSDTTLLDEYIIMNCFISLLFGYMLGFNQRQFTALVEKLHSLNYKRLGSANSHSFLGTLDLVVNLARNKDHAKIEELLVAVCRPDHPSQFLPSLMWSFKKILGEYLNELKINRKNSYLSKYYVTDHLFFQLGEVRPEDRNLYKSIRYCIEVFFLTIDAYCELVYIRRADLEYHYKNIFINKPKDAPNKKLLLYLVDIEEKLTIFTCHEHQFGLQRGGVSEPRVLAGDRRPEQSRVGVSRPESADPRNPHDLNKRNAQGDRFRLPTDFTGMAAKSSYPDQGTVGYAPILTLPGTRGSDHSQQEQLKNTQGYNESLDPSNQMAFGKTGKSTAITLEGGKDDKADASPTMTSKQVRAYQETGDHGSDAVSQQNRQMFSLPGENKYQVPTTAGHPSNRESKQDSESGKTQDTTMKGDRSAPEVQRKASERLELPSTENLAPDVSFFNNESLLSDLQEVLTLMEVNCRKLGLIKHSTFKQTALGGLTPRQNLPNRYIDHHSVQPSLASHANRGRSIGRNELAHGAASRFTSRGSGKSQDIQGYRYTGIPSYSAAGNISNSPGLGHFAANGGTKTGIGSIYSGLNHYNQPQGHTSNTLSSNRYHHLNSLGSSSPAAGMYSLSTNTDHFKPLAQNFGEVGYGGSASATTSQPLPRSPSRFNHLESGLSPSVQATSALGGLNANSSKISGDSKPNYAYSHSNSTSYRNGTSPFMNNLTRTSPTGNSPTELGTDSSSKSPQRQAETQLNLMMDQIY